MYERNQAGVQAMGSAIGSGSTLVGSQPAQQTPVDAAMDELNRALQVAHDEMDNLACRLATLMGAPLKEAGGTIAPDNPTSCEHEARIRNCRLMAAELARKARSTREMLCI